MSWQPTLALDESHAYPYESRLVNSEHAMMWTHPHVKKDEPLIQIDVPG
jgi:hypothetical protein